MQRKPGHPPVERRIAQLATAQHGVVGRDQLRALGLGAGAIEHRLRVGRLHQLHRGVYAVGHRRLSADARCMAAVLAVGADAVISHRSAAAVLDLRRTSAPVVDVTLPFRTGRRPRPGIRVHRSASLRAEDVGRCRGIPVTSPARTLLDLAEVIPKDGVERAVERADALRVLDVGAVRAVLAANPTRRGATVLADVLELDYDNLAVTRSELEARFLRLCAEHGLPKPLANARLGPFEVDFLWPEQRLVVETDGRETHATRAAFERDRARDARLLAAGYRVMRFTYRQVTREPEVVVALLLAVLSDAESQ